MPANVRHLEQPDPPAVRLDALERLAQPQLLLLGRALPLLDRKAVLGQVVAALVDVQTVLLEMVVELRGRGSLSSRRSERRKQM